MTNSTKAYAGYLQGDVNITDKLKVTAGIRYTDETKRVSFRDNVPTAAGRRRQAQPTRTDAAGAPKENGPERGRFTEEHTTR